MADKLIPASALYVRSHIADEALPANRFVKLVTATAHVVFADQGEAGVGVTRDGYDSGNLADIIHIGAAYVDCSENVDCGVSVCAENDGKAMPATTGDFVLGVALTAGSTSVPALILLSHGGIF